MISKLRTKQSLNSIQNLSLMKRLKMRTKKLTRRMRTLMLMKKKMKRKRTRRLRSLKMKSQKNPKLLKEMPIQDLVMTMLILCLMKRWEKATTKILSLLISQMTIWNLT